MTTDQQSIPMLDLTAEVRQQGVQRHDAGIFASFAARADDDIAPVAGDLA